MLGFASSTQPTLPESDQELYELNEPKAAEVQQQSKPIPKPAPTKQEALDATTQQFFKSAPKDFLVWKQLSSENAKILPMPFQIFSQSAQPFAQLLKQKGFFAELDMGSANRQCGVVVDFAKTTLKI